MGVMKKSPREKKYGDIKPWVKIAVAQEDAKPSNPMWKGEPREDKIIEAQQKRIRFLRKHGKTDPRAKSLAERLQSCRPRRRCLSGACPECGRLLQRWFVRACKRFISDHLETQNRELIAISIVPSGSTVVPGNLQLFSIANVHRRIKHALAKTHVAVAIGGINFSFNEDRDGKYQPVWMPHLHVITTTNNKEALKRELAKRFPRAVMIPRPIKISPFKNKARRWSYALKTYFGRRFGYDQKKEREGQVRNCRNTSGDKLRAGESLELFLFLDEIGLAVRPFFLGVKPHVSSDRVRLLRMG